VTASMQRCGEFSLIAADWSPTTLWSGSREVLAALEVIRSMFDPGWRTPVRRPDRLGQCLRAGSGLMKGVASASFIAAGRAER
jgi:hypothetical protein